MSAERVSAAVINAPEHQLRALVQALLTGDDHNLRNRVLDTFTTIQNTNTNDRKAELGDDSRATDGTPADVQNCRRCNTSFLLSENFGQECRYHPGELEFDGASETWQEWEYSEMDMDTMESREDFPEGFKFACCGGDGTAEGCKLGDHISRKKA
ncbi:hypothetical protein B0T18DRAFT_391017 [Schizothecium vesticola]|uniref:C2H2-type domain-containing protein n=1 Tax=Schizothecium vesticola TaxID=314040 RepID=A0AA40K5T8_9PEZI|nr:hypothetical protein B0T18DRAFT_391017 [Schizothecium vesticola]